MFITVSSHSQRKNSTDISAVSARFSISVLLLIIGSWAAVAKILSLEIGVLAVFSLEREREYYGNDTWFASWVMKLVVHFFLTKHVCEKENICTNNCVER